MGKVETQRQDKAKRIARAHTRAQIEDEEFGCFEAMAISRSPSLASSGGSSPNMSTASPPAARSTSSKVRTEEYTILGWRRKRRVVQQASTGSPAARSPTTPARSPPSSSASSSATSLTSCLAKSSRSSHSTASTSATTHNGSPTSSPKRKSVRFGDLGPCQEDRLEPIPFLKNPPLMGPIQLGRVVETSRVPTTPAWIAPSASGPCSPKSLPAAAPSTTPMPTFELCVFRDCRGAYERRDLDLRTNFVIAEPLLPGTSSTKDDGTVTTHYRSTAARKQRWSPDCFIYGPREVNLAGDKACADVASVSDDRPSPSNIDMGDNEDTVVIEGVPGIEVQRLWGSLAYHDGWAERIENLAALHRGALSAERITLRQAHIAALLKRSCFYVDLEYSSRSQTWIVTVSRLNSTARNPHMDRDDRAMFCIGRLYSAIYSAARLAGHYHECAPFCAWD